MDDWDAQILAAILEEALPRMQDATIRMSRILNEEASGAHGSLSGASSPGMVTVNGEVLTSTVDINPIPRPSLFPQRYNGANIYALFDSGYTVKKPVNHPRLLKHRDASNITDNAVSTFEGTDDLGISVSVTKPTGYL